MFAGWLSKSTERKERLVKDFYKGRVKLNDEDSFGMWGET